MNFSPKHNAVFVFFLRLLGQQIRSQIKVNHLPVMGASQKPENAYA